MRSVAVGGIFLLALVLFPFPRGNAQGTDYLIVPGRSVGGWELGKPLDSYSLGKPRWQWEGTERRIPYYNGYNYLAATTNTRLGLQLYTCRDDGLVFAVLVWRGVNVPEAAETEAFKYKTAGGIGVGSDESEVLKVLGRSESTSQWTERHGTLEVTVAALDYPGLRIEVNRGDHKVFAIGATSRGGWIGCSRAILGSGRVGPDPGSVTLGPSGVPIPKNVRIIPPGPEVPRDRAAFSGKWFGVFTGHPSGGAVANILIVEDITVSPPRVIVVYAWGPVLAPGWARIAGRFSGETLYLDQPDQSVPLITYRMLPDDTLEGSYQIGTLTVGAKMRRMKD